MASQDEIREGGRLVKIKVRWRDPDGSARARSVKVLEGQVDTARRAARELLAEVQAAEDCGRRWEPPDARRPPTVHEAALSYLRFVARGCAPGTVKNYAGALTSFEGSVGASAPVTVLTRQAIADWFDGLTVAPSTAHTYTAGVRGFILWASEEWPDLVRPPPSPKRLNIVRPTPPEPVAPTWTECDASLDHLTGTAHQVGVLMRYTGLRVSQVLNLRWDDLDLDACTLRVAPGNGKTRTEKRGRIVPISRYLAAELAGWGPRAGLMFGQRRNPEKPRSSTKLSAYFRTAWQAAGVRPEAWDAAGGRRVGKPAHAFRAAFVSELRVRGADTDAVEFLVGHDTQGARGYYLDRQMALGPVARDAAEKIARIGDAGGTVVPLSHATSPA